MAEHTQSKISSSRRLIKNFSGEEIMAFKSKLGDLLEENSQEDAELNQPEEEQTQQYSPGGSEGSGPADVED